MIDADELATDFFRYSIDEFINNPLNENKVGTIKG